MEKLKVFYPSPLPERACQHMRNAQKHLFSHFYCIPLLIKFLADLVKVKPKKEVCIYKIYSAFIKEFLLWPIQGQTASREPSVYFRRHSFPFVKRSSLLCKRVSYTRAKVFQDLLVFVNAKRKLEILFEKVKTTAVKPFLDLLSVIATGLSHKTSPSCNLPIAENKLERLSP